METTLSVPENSVAIAQQIWIQRVNGLREISPSLALQEPFLRNVRIVGNDTIDVVIFKHGCYEKKCASNNVAFALRDIWDIAMLICGHMHVCIVGEPQGLESELASDIMEVASLAGLPQNCIPWQAIKCNRLQNAWTEIHFDGKVFMVICTPTKQVLEMCLKSVLSLPTTTVDLYYCGHGSDDGFISLNSTECYSGIELKLLVENCGRAHGGDIHFHLNSCFGLAFAENAGCSLDLMKAVWASLSGQKLVEINSIIDRCLNGQLTIAEQKLSNETFTKEALRCVSRMKRSFPSFEAGKARIYLIIYSAGALDAKGILWTHYGLSHFWGDYLFARQNFHSLVN